MCGVGASLAPPLAVSSRQRLRGCGRPGALEDADMYERAVEAQCRIHRFIYVPTEVAQRRSITGQTTTQVGKEFNVNLKARWEY